MNEELPLRRDSVSVRKGLGGEGDGDLELDIHDFRASLDNDRDIDLRFPSTESGEDSFVLRISRTSSSSEIDVSEASCGMPTLDCDIGSSVFR